MTTSPSIESGLDRFRYRVDGCWRWPRGEYSGLRNRALAPVRRTNAWHTPPTRELSLGPEAARRRPVREEIPRRRRTVTCRNRMPSVRIPGRGGGTGGRELSDWPVFGHNPFFSRFFNRINNLQQPNPSAPAPHPLPSNQKSMSRSFYVTQTSVCFFY